MEVHRRGSQGRENIHEMQFCESKDEGSVQKVRNGWGEVDGSCDQACSEL